MSGTVIKKCENNCKHEFQDKTYGKGIRVHNIGKDKAVCTVCEGKKENANK